MVSIVLLSNYGDYDRSVFQNYHFSLFYGNFRFFFLKKAIYLGFFYIPAPIFFLFLILSKNAPVIVRIMSLSTFAEKMKLLSQVVFELDFSVNTDY